MDFAGIFLRTLPKPVLFCFYLFVGIIALFNTKVLTTRYRKRRKSSLEILMNVRKSLIRTAE